MRGRRTVLFFLCAQSALYISFLYLDVYRPQSGMDIPLKYCSILLCLVFCLSAVPHGGSHLVAAALCFTLLADTFLLVLNRHFILGLAAFCVVQLLYLCRIYRAGRLRPWPGLFCRLLLGLAALCAVALLGALEPLTALTALYFTQLAANAVESTRLWTLGRRYRLFTCGLFLFVACDLCVGLQNLALFFPVAASGGLFSFARVGMWLFYLPSQVLISCSATCERGP